MTRGAALAQTLIPCWSKLGLNGGLQNHPDVTNASCGVRLSAAERGLECGQPQLPPWILYCGALLYCVGSWAYRVQGTKNTGEVQGFRIPGSKGRGSCPESQGPVSSLLFCTFPSGAGGLFEEFPFLFFLHCDNGNWLSFAVLGKLKMQGAGATEGAQICVLQKAPRPQHWGSRAVILMHHLKKLLDTKQVCENGRTSLRSKRRRPPVVADQGRGMGKACPSHCPLCVVPNGGQESFYLLRDI